MLEMKVSAASSALGVLPVRYLDARSMGLGGGVVEEGGGGERVVGGGKRGRSLDKSRVECGFFHRSSVGGTCIQR